MGYTHTFMDIIVLSLIPELSLLALNPIAVTFQVNFALWHIQSSLNSILVFIYLVDIPKLQLGISC